MLRYNKVVGGMLLKQHRVMKTACTTSARELQHNRTNFLETRPLIADCYDTYKPKRMSRESFGTDPTLPGFFYVENIGGQVDEGFYYTYPEGGFIRNLAITPLTVGDDFLAELHNLFDNGWLDEQTRAVMIRTVFYNANYDINIQVRPTLPSLTIASSNSFPFPLTIPSP